MFPRSTIPCEEFECVNSFASIARLTQQRETAPQPQEGGREAKAPLVLRGCAKAWPAVGKWADAEFWRENYGHRFVPLERGGDYRSEAWSIRIGPWIELIERTFRSSKPRAPGTSHHPLKRRRKDAAACTAQAHVANASADQDCTCESDCCDPDEVDAADAGSSAPLYLGHFCAFSFHGTLLRDIEPPDELCVFPCTHFSRNLWMGPEGSFTPLHFDPTDNLFCQVVGSKRIVLFPRDFPGLAGEEGRKNTASLEQRPLCGEEIIDAKDAFWEAVGRGWRGWECVLNPGDALYIPEGCWHQCTALGPSISVSFWAEE